MLVRAFRVFPNDGAILGRLLTGYTDIEYQLCLCAGIGSGDVEKAITDVFSKRGETRRVRLAETGRNLWLACHRDIVARECYISKSALPPTSLTGIGPAPE